MHTDVEERREEIAHPAAAKRPSSGRFGRDLYEKLFNNYTRKQRGLDPSERDASVAARAPAQANLDDRYFTDEYQAMPLHGYTRMFERMLDHKNIRIVLNTNDRAIISEGAYRELIYTNEHAYTRCTDFKYLTRQKHHRTGVVREISRSEAIRITPCLALKTPSSVGNTSRSWTRRNAHFVGRLATYRYYNLDQVIAQALALVDSLVRTRLEGAEPATCAA